MSIRSDRELAAREVLRSHPRRKKTARGRNRRLGASRVGDRAAVEGGGLSACRSDLTENSRRAKFYALTRAGKKQLEVETADWARRASAIARLLKAEG